VITFEDHVLMHGFGSAVMEYLYTEAIYTPVERIGWPDEFIEHGKPEILKAQHHITAQAAFEKALQHLS
jgi:1-deoxy-D-xylulose-5-phosphate synthase